MAIGKRIKHIRNLRGLTQKELGEKIGFTGRTADVRIAQYESEARLPKENLLNEIANALDVSPHALSVPNIDSFLGVMHTLYALEDNYGFKVDKIDGQLCITLDNDSNTGFRDFFERFSDWYHQSERLSTDVISKEDYDQWRYNYPKY